MDNRVIGTLLRAAWTTAAGAVRQQTQDFFRALLAAGRSRRRHGRDYFHHFSGVKRAMRAHQYTMDPLACRCYGCQRRAADRRLVKRMKARSAT